MLKRKRENNKTADRVILEERVVSISSLRSRAHHANMMFLVAVLITAMISGMVVPYMSMAAGGASVGNSDAFSGEVIPGYSMGGISVGAYGVDLNEYSDVDGPTVTGSVYGYWDTNRTGQAIAVLRAGRSASDDYKSQLTDSLNGVFGMTRYEEEGRLMSGASPSESMARKSAWAVALENPFTLTSSDTQDDNDITRNAERRQRETEQARQRQAAHRASGTNDRSTRCGAGASPMASARGSQATWQRGGVPSGCNRQCPSSGARRRR